MIREKNVKARCSQCGEDVGVTSDSSKMTVVAVCELCNTSVIVSYDGGEIVLK